MRDPFPLQWPDGWRRVPSIDRCLSRFSVGMSQSLDSLYDALERIGAVNVVLTSDLPRRANGRPYGSAVDPGIAVWFVHDGNERVFACDKWHDASANIRAIALTIEAIRGMERWGAAEVITRAFSGFTALPAPAQESWSWRDVLGISSTGDPSAQLSAARESYRQLMKAAHPDIGGSNDRAIDLNRAMEAARLELEAHLQ